MTTKPMTKNEIVSAEMRNILSSNNGVLTAEKVLEAAENTHSPLHQYFEWDDSAAAQKYRLIQARMMIRVVVQYEQSPNNGGYIKVRQFRSLSSDRQRDGGGYRMLNDVLSDEEMKVRLLADAKKEMQVFQKKYREIEALAGVISAMQSIE